MESEKTTEQLIREVLDGAKDTMKANLVEEMKKSISNHLTWSLREEMSKMTSEFVKTEMTEDIKKLLSEQKPVIFESLKQAFIKIGAQVAQSMYETAAKNLSVGSYNTTEILKKILQ